MVGFGIDFGTTNSVVSAFNGRETRPFVDSSNLPHPSVLWYRGDKKPVVGREAKVKIESKILATRREISLLDQLKAEFNRKPNLKYLENIITLGKLRVKFSVF